MNTNANAQDTWLEPVPLAYRRTRALLAGGLALALAGGLLFAALQQHPLNDVLLFWVIVVLAVGVWRCLVWMRRDTVRKFRQDETALTRRQRWAHSWPYLVMGFGAGTGLFLWQWSTPGGLDYWPASFVFLPWGGLRALSVQ